MLNNTSLMGRLTRNPELRRTNNDIPVASFSLAVNRPKSKDGETTADFIDIVAWRQTAEFVSQYFHKGQQVAVEGRIQSRTYEDKDGNKRKAVEVVANRVHFAEGKKDTGGNGNGSSGSGQTYAAPPPDFTPNFGDEDDGEVPF